MARDKDKSPGDVLSAAPTAQAETPISVDGSTKEAKATTQPSNQVKAATKTMPVVGQAVTFFDKRWKGGVPASVKAVEADGTLSLLVTHPDKSTAQRAGIHQRSPEMAASGTCHNVWDWPV